MSCIRAPEQDSTIMSIIKETSNTNNTNQYTKLEVCYIFQGGSANESGNYIYVPYDKFLNFIL